MNKAKIVRLAERLLAKRQEPIIEDWLTPEEDEAFKGMMGLLSAMISFDVVQHTVDERSYFVEFCEIKYKDYLQVFTDDSKRRDCESMFLLGKSIVENHEDYDE